MCIVIVITEKGTDAQDCKKCMIVNAVVYRCVLTNNQQ